MPTLSNLRILSINVGSSTVKFGVYDMPSGTVILESHIDRVAAMDGVLADIQGELERAGINRLDAVGHRIAHGGSDHAQPVLIDADVEASIERCIPLAPQHNSANLAGVRMAREHWPQLPQVAVFDTAFHHTIPTHASTYAVPLAWREAGLKRYGFHGTSHQHVMEAVSGHLRVPATDLRVISCHLGNGASACAIDRGISIDTSMGMTALEGLVMGSRCGDLDPGAYPFLMRTLGLSAKQIETALYEESGLKALSGVGSDLRDVEAQALLGNTQARIALQAFAYRVRKCIGAYAAAMGGCDVIAFTGGIGEHSPAMRARICSGLEFLGVHFSADLNVLSQSQTVNVSEVQEPRSRIKVMVVRAREELMIANEVHRLLARSKAPAMVRREALIPVAVSARHVHLTEASVEALFGPGYRLTAEHALAQPGFWAARETVDVIGSKGRIDRVRVLGPCRAANQIEVTRSEAIRLGVDAPLRLSGDTEGTPVVTLAGPAGTVRSDGLIVARRHVHASPVDADLLGLKDGDHFEVSIDSGTRGAAFADVVLRVSDGAVLEMHIDTDEANAAGIVHQGEGVVVRSACRASICPCAPTRASQVAAM